VDLSRPASETLTISPRGRCSRSLAGLRIDSCSVKHVSDAYQDQDVLTDENGRRRADGEEELCLVSGRDQEAKRGVDYRQDAGELGFANEERNQPGKWKQQSDSDEEGGEHRGPQFMYTSLDSQWSQQEAENKAQPKQDCQYSLCSAERPQLSWLTRSFLNSALASSRYGQSCGIFGAECPISAPLPDSRPRKRPRAIDQRRSIVASQAWAPLSSIVTANFAGSIDLIDQPSTKAARSSACDTRRGPQSPGWRSLKHIR